MSKKLSRSDLLVLICDGKDCRKNGAKELRSAAKSFLKKEGQFKRTLLLKSKCTGNCKKGPICGIYPDDVWLTQATAGDLTAAIARALDTRES